MFTCGTDYTAVKFTGLDKIFNIRSTAFIIELFGKQVEVKWYGIIIAFGFTLAVLFGGRMAYKWKMDINKMLDVLIYGTFCGIIGARLYYVFSKWDDFHSLKEIFNIRGGGLAIYGGLIGGLVAAYLVCKIEKLNFYNLLDMAGMSFLIGQGIGRWGNFMNQEAFGTNTTLPWGMWSQKIANTLLHDQASLQAKGITVDPMQAVHPTFLYESIWCLAGFGILYLICRKYRKFSGQIFICYGIWYGTGRFIFEGLRTDSLYLGSTGIRTSQLLSAVLVLACVALLVTKLIKYTKQPQPIEGVDFFPEPSPARAKKSAAAAQTGESSGETGEPSAETDETVKGLPENNEVPPKKELPPDEK